jgi:hypothetical protein
MSMLQEANYSSPGLRALFEELRLAVANKAVFAVPDTVGAYD